MMARTRLPCELLPVVAPFRPAREPCLLLGMAMEMCVLAHPWLQRGLQQPVLPCAPEEIPHLGFQMGFKYLAGFSS